MLCIDVTIRLDEDDYMGSETAGHAIIRVERIDAIATPVTVRVLPMSYTDYLIQGFDPLPPGRVGILAAGIVILAANNVACNQFTLSSVKLMLPHLQTVELALV